MEANVVFMTTIANRYGCIHLDENKGDDEEGLTM